jgi:SAM-dependent methyltransferase
MKRIISLALRKVPRRHLQFFSHYVLRILAVFYRGNTVECPIDGRRYRKFLPYGRLHPRPNALCPSSLSLERHRLMWLYLRDRTDFFTSRLHVLHIAPELCFIDRFKSMPNLDYISADIESPLADVVADLLRLPFGANTFDVAFCNHVMEHVEDDIQGMREIYRVLRPGGWAIIQSPVYYDLEQTIEDPSVTDPAAREKLYGQDDHLRKFGRDYPDRLRLAGFDVHEDDYVQQLSDEVVRRYALPKEEIIYLCRKGT